MADALGAISKVIGVAGTAAMAGASGISKSKLAAKEAQKAQQEAIDIKMAQKARRVAQNKINAIIENKELSRKAMTRRIGQVLDTFKEGGKK